MSDNLYRVKPNQGFTLIETLIAVGILAVVGLSVTYFITQNMSTSKKISQSTLCDQAVNSAVESLDAYGTSLHVVNTPIFQSGTPSPIQPPQVTGTPFVRQWKNFEYVERDSGVLEIHTYQLIQNSASALLAEYNLTGSTAYCNGLTNEPNILSLFPDLSNLRDPNASLRINFVDTNGNETCPSSPFFLAPKTNTPIDSSEFNRLAETEYAIKAEFSITHQGGVCFATKTYSFSKDTKPSQDFDLSSAPVEFTAGDIDTSNPDVRDSDEPSLASSSTPGVTADYESRDSHNTNYDNVTLRVPMSGSGSQNYSIERGSVFICRGSETSTMNDLSTLAYGEWNYCGDLNFPNTTESVSTYFENDIFVLHMESLGNDKVYRIEFGVIDSAGNITQSKVDIAVVTGAPGAPGCIPDGDTFIAGGSCCSGNAPVDGFCCPVPAWTSSFDGSPCCPALSAGVCDTF